MVNGSIILLLRIPLIQDGTNMSIRVLWVAIRFGDNNHHHPDDTLQEPFELSPDIEINNSI